MRGFTLNTVCHCGLFACLILLSFVSCTGSVSLDLAELRNKVAKIKVNPRGNLWATGHFMGKKSVMDAPLLPPAQGPADDDALELSLPVEQSALLELFHHFLRGALQAQVDTRERSSDSQEADMLMKILESYIQRRK
ncbi:neuromedin Bb [Gasterosteus aculeatus]|uniref:Neuromedin Bb n=1 Tax=Gasterosteus aculeatus aculeatus TaxID=481459 RepID=A0AAQ4R4J5_GASAC|nr:neuromedin Bb [Gasterosteus aculeatus aculeatus]